MATQGQFVGPRYFARSVKHKACVELSEEICCYEELYLCRRSQFYDVQHIQFQSNSPTTASLLLIKNPESFVRTMSAAAKVSSHLVLHSAQHLPAPPAAPCDRTHLDAIQSTQT